MEEPPHRVRTSTPLRALVAAAALAGLTGLLVSLRGELAVATSLSLYLLLVVAITAVAGRTTGIIAAVVAPVVANWYLIPPYGTLRIRNRDNVIELIAFVSVAFIVSWFVAKAAQRRAEAERAWREARALIALSTVDTVDPLDGMLGLLDATFRFNGSRIVHSDTAPTHHSGSARRVSPGAWLVLPPATLSTDDLRLLDAFTGQIGTALEQQRLRQIALDAAALARADELRTAMLRAVSHDLRSPLAGIKASVSTLRQQDVEWTAEQQEEFLASIEDETDRLTTMVTDLLDLGRLEAGVLRPTRIAVGVDEVVAAALAWLGDRSSRCTTEIADDLPPVDADPALLERVFANLLDNAAKFSPPDTPVLVRATSDGSEVAVDIIDHGPGIPSVARSTVIQPFHRLADSGSGGGLGLGLAIVDRLMAAMHGRLELGATDGGGLTARITLPVAAR